MADSDWLNQWLKFFKTSQYYLSKKIRSCRVNGHNNNNILVHSMTLYIEIIKTNFFKVIDYCFDDIV